jgi:NADPH:quinone reductase-like Zn-dependent oxidoreductase
MSQSTTRALVVTRPGGPEVLEVQDRETPDARPR